MADGLGPGAEDDRRDREDQDEDWSGGFHEGNVAVERSQAICWQGWVQARRHRVVLVLVGF